MNAPLPEEDAERCQIRSRTEIIAILRDLQRANPIIAIAFSKRDEFVLTSLLRIDPERDELIFDWIPHEASVQRLLNAERLTVMTQHNRIKIEFSIGNANVVRFDGRPAIRTSLPQFLVRLQRRELFRAAPLTSRPIVCQLRIDAEDGDGAMTNVTVLDISGSGVALAVERTCRAATGKIFRGLRLQLPDEGEIVADAEVRNVAPFTRGRISGTRLGCRFVNLAASEANAIQRYIRRLEMSRRRLT